MITDKVLEAAAKQLVEYFKYTKKLEEREAKTIAYATLQAAFTEMSTKSVSLSSPMCQDEENKLRDQFASQALLGLLCNQELQKELIKASKKLPQSYMRDWHANTSYLFAEAWFQT